MDENKEISNNSKLEPINGETLQTSELPVCDSNIKGVSVRGILAALLTSTLCAMTLLQFDVKEPFYSVSVFSIGFYFGQKKQ